MISESRYKEVLDSGLLLDHYFILCSIKNGEKLNVSKRIQGFINLLTKKGYLQDEQLTEKAQELLLDCEASDVILPVSKNEISKWIIDLHGKLKIRLRELTGKSQYYLNVKGINHPYLPGIKDLEMKLQKFMRVYKYTDLDKIEKCLLKHCEVRNQKMIYYIMREKTDAKSDLAADYENFNDLDQDEQVNTRAQKLL